MSGRDPLSGTTPVDSTGAPYALATIDYYIVGTTTREDTYTTAALTVANSNPITLGADGRIPEIFFGQTRMKRVFKDADGNTISGLSWDGIDKTKQRIKSAAAPSPTYPGLEWHDSDDDTLYERNSTNDGWTNRGDVDSIGNTASISEVRAGTEAAKLVTPDSLAAMWQRGATITPSAGAITIPSDGGKHFNLAAGNFSSCSTTYGGTELWFLCSGINAITYDATSMEIDGGVSYTTAAGDIVVLINKAATDTTGTNYRVLINKKSGSPVNITDQLGSQSDAEAGTSTTKTLSIGNLKYYDGALKAWINFSGAAAPTIADSFGVTSLDDDGVGLFGINMSITMSSTNYPFVGYAESTTLNVALIISRNTTQTAKAAGAFDIRCTRSDVSTNTDSTDTSVLVAGDL